MTKGHLSNGRIVIQGFKKIPKSLVYFLESLYGQLFGVRSPYKFLNVSHTVIVRVTDVHTELTVIRDDKSSVRS